MSRLVWFGTGHGLPFLWAIAVALTGCGKPVAPVHGRVTLQGKPIGPGTIYFMPDRAEGNKSKTSLADFGRDGMYDLTVQDGRSGALVGHYKVAIVPKPIGKESPGADGPLDHLAPIPLKYSNIHAPILAADITRGGTELNFDLQP